MLGYIVALCSVELRFFAPYGPKMVNDIGFTISRFQSFLSFSAEPKWSSSNLVWIEMQLFFSFSPLNNFWMGFSQSFEFPIFQVGHQSCQNIFIVTYLDCRISILLTRL